MDRVWVENYRCFREKQDVPLAPLTLLLGENSTGKTSFLAMINALISSMRGETNFKKPYDLGSFDEIVHYQGGDSKRADSFIGGFQFRTRFVDHYYNSPCRLDLTFKKESGAPSVAKTRAKIDDIWIEIEHDNSAERNLAIRFLRTARLGSDRGEWEYRSRPDEKGNRFIPLQGFPDAENHETNAFAFFEMNLFQGILDSPFPRIIPSAPVRSNPKRTYDLSPLTHDPEGAHIPSVFAHLSAQDPEKWANLKAFLEEFGKESGLFDEIDVIRPLKEIDSAPFQIRVRKTNGGIESPWRNLLDVGYGVSQALPTATELFFQTEPVLYLLQQPETHLHPSAQAALGTQLCRIASPTRQLIVETHSDYLMDRVRMDVRDQKTDLTPEDVIILFFERDGLDVRIWPIKFDELGNIKDAPDSYRRFFLKETNRSIGL